MRILLVQISLGGKMKPKDSWWIKLGQAFLGAAIVIALVLARGAKAGNESIHMTADWSHQHLVFSAPHDLKQHIRLLSSPRYVQQTIRRKAGQNGDPNAWRWRRARQGATPLHADWSEDMGAGATVGADTYPAKYSFNAGVANCATPAPTSGQQPDFVVYNTSLPGLASGTDASQTGTFASLTVNSTATTLKIETITNGANSIVLYSNTGSTATTAAGTVTTNNTTMPTAGNTVTVGPVGSTTIYNFETALVPGSTDVLIGTTAASAAGNLEAAINDNASECVTAAPCFGTGITAANAAGTASIAGLVVTITAPVAGAANNFTLASNGSSQLAVGGAAGTGGSGSNTGLNFLSITNVTTAATNLSAAIVRNGGTVGVTSTSSGGMVTVTATIPGTAGNSIALAQTTSNFVWAGSTLANGTNAQASIVAFDNLYSGCTSPTPTTYWAYNTGTAGAVQTSPILSGGGDQVAFVQNTATASTLVILRWAANTGTLTAPVAPTAEVTTSYQGCIAPCQTTITFSGTAALDTTSSPFYDYANDVIYVGDSNGFLHKFTGVFSGTPAEVVSSGADVWPASVDSGGILTSPVFDDGIGKIFVGSNNGTLYSVDSTIGSGATGITNSGVLGAAGIDDSPLVDVTLNNVYVFVRGDEGVGANERAGVYQCTAILSCTETVVSSSSTIPLTAFYGGTFDNTYYTSAGGTGSMYVCSTNGGLTAMWEITVTADVLSAPTAGPTISTANVDCSPVTEFYNGTQDMIFLSVTGSSVTGNSTTGNTVDCPTAGSGCIMSYQIPATTWSTASPATNATAAETGGTSGIVVDGSSTFTGASQIYFTPLANQTCTTSTGTGGCAIQASQSGLD